jgi:hypothetical protein
MAFDNGLEAGVVVDRDAFSSCVRRRLRIGTRRVATLFQHTNAAAPLSVSFLRDRTDDWIVAISGAGFAARVTLNSNELRLDEEPQPAV